MAVTDEYYAFEGDVIPLWVGLSRTYYVVLADILPSGQTLSGASIAFVDPPADNPITIIGTSINVTPITGPDGRVWPAASIMGFSPSITHNPPAQVVTEGARVKAEVTANFSGGGSDKAIFYFRLSEDA